MEEGDGDYMTADIPEDRDGQIATLKALEAQLTRSEETLEYETDRRKYFEVKTAELLDGADAAAAKREADVDEAKKEAAGVEAELWKLRYEIEKLKQTRADEDAGH